MVKVPIEGLLSEAYADERRKLIDLARANPDFGPGDPRLGLRSGSEIGTRKAGLQDTARHRQFQADIKRSCGTPNTASIGARRRCARTAWRLATDRLALRPGTSGYESALGGLKSGARPH